MSDPYPIDPNTDNSIDLATVIEVLADDDATVVGDRNNYYPTKGRVVKESPSGNRWLGDGDQWISLETDVGMTTPALDTDEENNSVYWVKGDDGFAIQDTIDAAPAGATVALEAKTYTFDFLEWGGTKSDRMEIDKPLHFKGMGRGASKIKLADNSTETDKGANILAVRSDNVTLSNFTMDGNWQNNSPGEGGGVSDGHNIDVIGDKFRMTNVNSINSTGDGVELIQGADDAVISGCWLYNNWEHGIGLNGCKNPIIYGCHLDTEVNNAVIGTYNGSSNPSTQDVKIISTRVSNAQNRGINLTSGNGLLDGATVRDVDIVNSGAYPVRIVDGQNGQQPVDINLTDVRIYGAGESGIYVRNAKDVVLENIKTKNTQKQGIWVEDPQDLEIRDCRVIDGNQSDGDYAGIKIVASGTSRNIIVEDNHIESTTTPKHRHGVTTGGGGDFVNAYCRDNTIINPFSNNYVSDFKPFNERVRNGVGSREDFGTATASGDGSAVTFEISHDLSRAPSSVNLTPASADAAADYWVSNITGSVVNVKYSSAPPSGTDNLSWEYHVAID